MFLGGVFSRFVSALAMALLQATLSKASLPSLVPPPAGLGVPLRVPSFLKATCTAAHASLVETTGLRAPELSPATAGGATAREAPCGGAAVPRASAPSVGSGLSYATATEDFPQGLVDALGWRCSGSCNGVIPGSTLQVFVPPLVPPPAGPGTTLGVPPF